MNSYDYKLLLINYDYYYDDDDYIASGAQREKREKGTRGLLRSRTAVPIINITRPVKH